MSTIQSVYRWITPKGNLDLVFQEDQYNFSLEGRNQPKTIIPITESHAVLFSQADKIEAMCERYFPVLIQNHRYEWTAVFHLSAVPLVEMGNQPPKSFAVSFNQLENKKEINFAKDAPFYRRVISGLNIQGECSNSGCDAYEQTVFVPQGMGSFNIAQLKHTSSCPSCHEKLPFDKVNNLGFWNCNYEIEGQRADQVDAFVRKKVAEKELYTTFTPEEECAWEYIQVVTTPLEDPARHVVKAPLKATPVPEVTKAAPTQTTQTPIQNVTSREHSKRTCAIL